MNAAALILERESPSPPSEAAELLTEHCDLHPGEARTVLRRSGGILVPRGTPEQLETLRAAFGRFGVETRVVPFGELHDVPHGKRALGIEFAENQLVFRLGSGRELPVWHLDLRAIDVFATPRSNIASRSSGSADSSKAASEASSARWIDTWASVLPPDVSKRTRRFAEALGESGESGLELRMTLFSREPFGVIRLFKDSIDYSSLGEAKSTHSVENFLALTERVLDSLPHLWNRTPWAACLRSLDTDAPVETGGWLRWSEEEIARFERWQLYWIREAENELEADLAHASAGTTPEPDDPITDPRAPAEPNPPEDPGTVPPGAVPR